MNIHIKAIAAAVLAVGLTSGSYAASAQSAPAPAAKKPVKHHAKPVPKPKPAPPATAAELQELKEQMETQINALKEQLSSKDSQLKQAQDAAAAAQASASRAEAAASSQQQAVTENAAAVTTLQSTVTDLKANQVGMVTTIQDGQAQVKKAIENPDSLHYKGIELTPGGFTAAETVYRTRATGGDIATPFTSIPFEATNAANLSEWYSTARQSRVSLMATGKLPWGTLHGYWEADWLGTGVTSNNNQSNSYVMRQRVIWGQAALNNGWAFTGGQLWSLAAENAKGIDNTSSNTPLPQTIDPNYAAGFVWTRQYGFRVTKSFDKFAIGVSAENPQVLSPAGSINLNPNTTYLWGQPGSGGGLYNGGASTTNGTTVGLLTTYAINPVPDFLAKVTFDPSFGHYEIFGIGRFFRDRVFGFNCPTGTTTCTTSTTGITYKNAYNDTEVGGGLGGSARVSLFEKKLTLGLKGLWGTGVGRYGDTTIADVTLKPNGNFSPLHNFSGLSTVEVQATPRLLLYANYGGDYVGKTIYLSQSGAKDGYGLGEAFSGCASEPLPTGPTYPASNSKCTGQTRDIQETTVGYWYDFYKGPKGRLRQGIQYSYAEKFIWDNLALTQGSVSPKGIENMVWTSFRYYIP
jgi:Skp family chaperone for outer membrane proteins